MPKPANATQYIAAQHADARKVLKAVRALFATVVPRAICKLDGGNQALELWLPDVGTVMLIKARKNHFELSPVTPKIRAACRADLAPFVFKRDDRPYRQRGAGIRTGTGGQDDLVLIPYDVPFPTALITKMAKLRAAERIAKGRIEKKEREAKHKAWTARQAKRKPGPTRREREREKHLSWARASRLAWERKVREAKKKRLARGARK